ncbi:hypothetical protein, partial [Methylosinus sp. R-45379]|uniref:hypothetical protein n=1 Tax=Methylosinus sp. R-45379 TaxID=980563 RepID=UPI000ADD0AA6
EYFGPAAQQRMPLSGNEAGRLAKDTMQSKFWGYRTSHQEWFAQEWAKWVASSEHPRTTADRFWKGVADFWKRIYYIATGETPANVPTEAFKEWVNGHYNENAVPAKGRLGREAALALEGEQSPREAIGEPVVYPGRPELSPEGGLGRLRDGDVARTALGGIRFSIAGVLGKSNNPAVRALGGLLVEDNVGKQGGAVTPHSAELYKRQKVNSSVTRIAQARKPALDEWKKENGLSWIEARNREGEFESTVADAMRLPNSSAEFQALPNWAKTYAQHLNKVADEVRQHMNEPFLTEGIQGRPVDGFGAVAGDEKYLMRAWSARKISEVVNAKGYDHFVSVITGAIADAQPGLPFAVLDKLGKGMAREIYKRAQGVVDENVARMFAVDNLESVKADLTTRYGLSEDEASDVVRRLRKGSDASADPRAKRRVLMNEQFEGNGTKLSDLLVNNATALTAAYAKHGWGKVALARTRVIDPKTGELLLDGITNDGDWNAALNAVRAIGHDNGVPHTTTEQEIEALQVAYAQIKGVGHPLQNEQWAKALRTFQRLNLLRLGHQFTFAQMGEAYNMLSGLSLEAMAKTAPSFRRIVTADGRWVKANGLDRWVENVFGLGGEGIRLIADTTHADDLHSLPMEASGFWDHADHALNSAGNAVLH